METIRPSHDKLKDRNVANIVPSSKYKISGFLSMIEKGAHRGARPGCSLPARAHRPARSAVDIRRWTRRYADGYLVRSHREVAQFPDSVRVNAKALPA